MCDAQRQRLATSSSHGEGSPGVHALSNDLLRRIFAEPTMDARDLALCRQVSRDWRQLAGSWDLPGNRRRAWSWWRQLDAAGANAPPDALMRRWLHQTRDLPWDADIKMSDQALSGLFRAAGARWPFASLERLWVANGAARCGRSLALLRLSPQLVDLCLEGPASHKGLGEIFKCSQLERLGLARTPISGEQAHQLAGLSKLTHLRLSDCPLDAGALAAMAALPALAELTLSGLNGPASQEMQALAASPRLRRLTIVASEIEPARLAEGLVGSRLQRLALVGCPGTTPGALALLRAALTPTVVMDGEAALFCS